MTFSEKIEIYLIPRLEKEMEIEKQHLTFLKNQPKDTPNILNFIEYSALAIDHLYDRLTEYKKYLKENI